MKKFIVATVTVCALAFSGAAGATTVAKRGNDWESRPTHSVVAKKGNDWEIVVSAKHGNDWE